MPNSLRLLTVAILAALATVQLPAARLPAAEPSAPAKPAAKAARPQHKHEPAYQTPAEAGADFKFQGEFTGTPEGSDSAGACK